MPLFKKKSGEKKQGALSNFLSQQGEALGNELDKLVDEEDIESRVDGLRKNLANRKEKRAERDSRDKRVQQNSQENQVVSADCLTKLFLSVADLVIDTSEGIYEGLVQRGIVSRRKSFFQSQRNKDRDFLLGVIAFSLIILVFLFIILLIVKILF